MYYNLRSACRVGHCCAGQTGPHQNVSTPGIPCAGVPTTPVVTASTGGQSSATITWDASATSAYYLVELLYQGTVKKSARVQHRCGLRAMQWLRCQ